MNSLNSRRGTTDIPIKDLLKYLVLSLLLIAVILFIVKYSDSTLIFQHMYARDTATLRDAVSAAPGNVIIKYDNIRQDKQFIFTFTDNIVGLSRKKDAKVSSFIKEWAETGVKEDIEYSLGKSQRIQLEDDSFVSPAMLFFAKKDDLCGVSDTRIDISSVEQTVQNTNKNDNPKEVEEVGKQKSKDTDSTADKQDKSAQTE